MVGMVVWLVRMPPSPFMERGPGGEDNTNSLNSLNNPNGL
jgi:hypothetical protein